MGDLGRVLREARDRKGCSLEDLSRTTRIPVRVLASLEEERFEEWPREVFVKGFVRSWCQATDLDPGVAMPLLQEALQHRVPASAPSPTPIPILPVTGAHRAGGWKGFSGQWAYLGILLVLVLGLLAILLTQRGGRDDLSRASSPLPGYQRTVPTPLEVN